MSEEKSTFDGRLEIPGDAIPLGRSSDYALMSIAISLKRIADLMDANLGDDARNEYGESPMQAIGGGISRALRRNGQ